MNKGELIVAVASKEGIAQKKADKVVTAFIEVVKEAVAEGEKVILFGFGSFEARERKARMGRNPQTQEEIVIQATKVPRFSAGKLFKEKVRLVE